MVAVTYGVARVPADKATERAQAAAPRKSYFHPLHGCADGVAPAAGSSRDCEARTFVVARVR